MNAWQIPCLRGVMGDWVFYSVLMTAEQIAKRVQTSKNIREAKSLEDFLQRELRERVKGIAKYLTQRPNRFFNSIIIGVFDALPQWVQFDLSKAANELGMPDAENVQDSLGVLIFDGKEKMFAIDGQHRVEGIKIARASKSATVALDQYPVILVAHVDNKPGKIRTRRLFSDINKRAVPVSNGDKVVIDEDELNALVARRIYAELPEFKHGKLVAITEKEKLPEGDDKHFTNLLTLYAVNKKLRKVFRRTPGVPEYAPSNVEAFSAVVRNFYEFVFQNEPSYRRFFYQRKTTLKHERDNNANILFRPIGLVLLASLYSYFASCDKLHVLSDSLKNIQFKSPGGIFDSVLWNSGRIEAKAENRKAALEICLYVLGELDQRAEAELLERLKRITKNPKYSLPRRIVTNKCS